MNNKENYKKAIENIHASEKLKRQTFEKITENRKRKLNLKFVYAFASIAIVLSVGSLYTKQIEKNNNPEIPVVSNNQTAEKNDIPRFASLEELKEVLKENTREMYKGTAIIGGLVVEDALATTNKAESITQDVQDYSTTNVQVANVDEADIVKTDGEYIYYVKGYKVYVVKADEMKIVSEIVEIRNDNSSFAPREIYIKDNKLIILGNRHQLENQTFQNKIEGVLTDSYNVTSKNFAEAIVYDISDKENPKQERVVSIDGNYTNSRMIGDNLYFISNKYPYYHRSIGDEEILPICKDTAVNSIKRIPATDIAYFPDTESYSYMLVAGFNINNQEEVNVETFFGASDTIYASENNLYITHMDYSYRDSKTIIYKFNLKNSEIKFAAKGEIEGDLNNQFSMDEYEGNLRIATTSYKEESTNQLYVLDENLKEIGKIENMALDEKIYSVRFIGKVGYIVTFKEIDPLFVIDLSNPTNPEIKGELKIPGYSAYLHPYDENHIIGIGYNTKDNSRGGVTNTTLKMSMFDVSDVENPKEVFNVSIGNNYSYSNIMYNHKQLFYNKSKNLIGFPVALMEDNYRNDKDALVIYEIDLENGFKKYGEISQKRDYLTNIDRAIYIGDVLYTLSETRINSYDLNTFEELKQLELE